MHTVWKGSVSFGLVNIPIKMFAATEEKDIKFRYLHKDCHTPVKYDKICPTCRKSLKEEDIVKGYEYESGRFIIIDDHDLDALRAEAGSKSIEILDFVNLSEIDPIFFDKSYYLSPPDANNKAYDLLRKAMSDTGKIAIARMTIRNKQTLAVLRVFQNTLVLETIYYPDEVRPVSQIPALPENAEVNPKELDIAVKLIENLTANFEPQKYQNNYRQALLDLIQKKIEGNDIQVAPEAPQKNVIDLMEALQASLKETQHKPDQKPSKSPRRKTSVS
ncbi:DNA end-binding protein Ku [Syntrophobotulus glycolicus DSM 8271]|uniref:Non-homologous end joining protein Ku n=1 Tax=Syntrophobotulus glycolicus (strain DSM 8271 / FlGlyR) TaxID=645991 RepID=F0SUC5_SYNGF|nr:Ku protein [Syntrophobotulus glycolicus]ADY56575.1 DNA end-binding protein Ku [Syntrophobotulus glycolicus DSM 8271]